MSEDTPAPRRGRPPKADSEKKMGGNLTIRTYGPLREQLETAASASGRSLSAEVEHRLEQSFWMEAAASAPEDDDVMQREISLTETVGEIAMTYTASVGTLIALGILVDRSASAERNAVDPSLN